MFRLDIIAVGRLKKGALHDLFQDYAKRIKWHLNLREVESKHRDPVAVQADENRQILSTLDDNAFVIVLDEKGNGLRSLDFAKTLEQFQNTGETHIQFVIGGADGLTEDVRGRANMLLSFGQQTWPHMMARVMLIEQVYRAQQIMAGHPYHRE